jgi:hypothetical protein
VGYGGHLLGKVQALKKDTVMGQPTATSMMRMLYPQPKFHGGGFEGRGKDKRDCRERTKKERERRTRRDDNYDDKRQCQ